MKFIGHRFVFAAAAAFLALAGKGDDAAGIMRIDAGTNGVVEAEMPFDAVDGNGPSDFISGFFMGDGSIFSDRLYRFPADSGNEPTPGFGLQSSNAVQSSFAFWSGEHWLDSVTLSNSTMTASAGDTLYLLRTDSDPFSFYLHGRIPSLSSVPSSQFPVFTHISVDPAETNAVVAMETDRAADLFFAQSETNAPVPSVWSYLGRHPGSLSFLYPLTANDYPLTAFLVSDATRDTDGDGLSDALEELVHGTNPLLADTDGDGVGDALEIAWGRDPLVSGPAPLTLFSESFEAPEVLPGPLDGQHGWNAPTGAVVQTERVHSGAAALMIESEPYESVAATHSITSSLPRSETWLDCRVSAGSCDSIGFPPDDGSFVAFSFDRFGHPVMLDGSAVVTNTSFQIPFDDTFRRVTLRLDFAASRWDIYVDGVLAGENLAMRGENPSLNEMVVSGNSGYIDDITVTTARPEGLSSDGDRMADEWELFHFGDLSRDGTLDFDSDGLSDEEEYLHGADPKTGDTDSDGIPDLWEAANGLDPADPSDAALDPDGDGLANTEEYFYDSDPFTAENTTFFLKEGFRDGVNASFYRSGGSITSLPDFSTLQFVESRIVTNINQHATRLPWNDAPPSLIDNFAADYTGYIYVPINGTVRFKLTSNDGSRLAIDGETIIDHNGTHSMQSRTGSVFLLAGLHAFRVEYFEATTEAGLILSWHLPGASEEVIPAEFFYIPKRPGSENTDLDNDGVPDWWEKVNGYDTSDPSDAASDPDGDGLTNAEEAALGSNPFSPDTDGDGLADAEEAAFGSSSLKADTDGDGLADAIEHRYGWNPNWPGETNEANAIGPFTTFTHYADGTPAAPQMRLMRSLRSGTGGIAQFHVDVDFQEPYPTNATVYGVSSPGGTTYVDDMITRDEYMDYTSIWSSNIIHVTTLDPNPAFCTNVAGVLILKMRCDDHGVLAVGDLAVTNAWPNRNYAKAWKVIEANTTNTVDVTWDSRDGGKWNFDYECYFYPEDIEYDVNIESGTDVPLSTYNELSEELGYPVPVWTNDFSNAGVLALSVDTHLHCGTVRIAFSNANDAAKFQLWTKKTNPAYDFDEELILGGEIGAERVFTKTQWDRLVEKFSCDDTLEVYVLSSGEGVVNLKLSYDVGRPEIYPPAFKSQRMTSVGPVLLVDYNRDGIIDESDIDVYLSGRNAYFWVNDDEWDGDDAFDTSVFDRSNSSNDYIDGRNDLINQLPFSIDLKTLATNWNQSVVYKIEPYGESIEDAKFVFCDVGRDQVGEIPLDLHYDIDGNPIRSASVTELDDGVEIPDSVLALTHCGRSTMLMEFPEFAREGSGLRLNVYFGESLVFSSLINLHIGDVSRMIAWVNLRGVLGDSDGVPTRLNTPDWPAVEHELGNVVFVHGYNMAEDAEVPLWAANVFKKLWWAGLDRGFVAVQWVGNEGQMYVPFEGWVTPNYYGNVQNAFATAPVFKNTMDGIGGPKWFIAHSLGNMLVSAAIHDFQMPHEKYFMLNAAVAMEAYDPVGGITQSSHDNMTPQAWTNYADRVRATHWYELFPGGDGRRLLTWKGRFCTVTNIVNFYSSQEEVVCNGSGTQVPYGRPYAWYNQEYRKGSWAMMLHEYEGGWAFNSFHDTVSGSWFGDKYVEHRQRMSPQDAASLTDEVLRQHPFFLDFADSKMYTSSNGLIVSTNYLYRAEMLAYAIPSESFAVGANPLPGLVPMMMNSPPEELYYNYDMAILFTSGQSDLPQNGEDMDEKYQDWQHSTFVQRSYKRVHQLYKEIIHHIKEYGNE